MQVVLSIPETAEILGRHPVTIRRMIRNGELGGVLRHGGGWVLVSSVEALIGAPLHLDPKPDPEQVLA